MLTALENHVASRRQAEDFQAKVQAALAEEEARAARTRAMLLGTAPAEGTVAESSTDAPATGRGKRKDEATG